MKKFLIAIILCIVLFTACKVQQQTETPTAAPTQDETPPPAQTTPAPTQAPEPPKELTCEEKAQQIIPTRFKFSMASNHDPDTGYWTISNDTMFTDGTKFDYKGDIRWQKGRFEGESLKNLYTRNIQNEKLFGEGGIKYSKKVVVDGIAGKREFYFKPEFKVISQTNPAIQADRYMMTAEITDYGFVSCEWLG